MSSTTTGAERIGTRAIDRTRMTPPPRTARPAALHPRNRHRGHYDFARLLEASPALAAHLVTTPRGDTSIDFGRPASVRALNRAILRSEYGIAHWDLPDGALCPPIPGRADYLHGLADLLAGSVDGNGNGDGDAAIPRGMAIRVLDVGVGANCIYPLLGHAEYGWRFVGSDVETTSLQVATAIVQANRLDKAIALRAQPRRSDIFRHVVRPGERFDLTMCNPPFYASAGEAAGTHQRKRRQLGKTTAPAPAPAPAPAAARTRAPAPNFGGHAHELWCPGGEADFLRRMIRESADLRTQVLWFTSLVARAEHLPALRRQLRQSGAVDIREVPMAQGHKRSRFIAWSFLDAPGRAAWRRGDGGT